MNIVPFPRPAPLGKVQCADRDACPWRRRQGDEGSDRRRLRRRLRQRRLAPLEDQARFDLRGTCRAGDRLAFTTDSFVVDPLVFPGGDIGKLAVCGTVNDLAVGGARPLYLSCAVIIEEGVADRFAAPDRRSMAAAAQEAGVQIVTGDTKVVQQAAPATSCSSPRPASASIRAA